MKILHKVLCYCHLKHLWIFDKVLSIIFSLFWFNFNLSLTDELVVARERETSSSSVQYYCQFFSSSSRTFVCSAIKHCHMHSKINEEFRLFKVIFKDAKKKKRNRKAMNHSSRTHKTRCNSMMDGFSFTFLFFLCRNNFFPIRLWERMEEKVLRVKQQKFRLINVYVEMFN